MKDFLPVHEPLLINTLGHSAGTLIFAIFIYLLLRDRAGSRLRGSSLTIAAAALAFLWNFLSLLVIALGESSVSAASAMVAISSSALSMLPAVLLDLSLGNGFKWLRRAGYGLAAITVFVHMSELVWPVPERHELALRLTTLGFGALTLIAVAKMLSVPSERRSLTPRLAGTMSLFLFALSFVHFGERHAHSWSGELIAHHAGIALALFVLLQDYRFLLLDAFVRFLVNIFFAAMFVWALIGVIDPAKVLTWAARDPFRQGMLLVAGCFLLLGFATLRSLLRKFLDHAVFPRNDLEELLQEIRSRTGSAVNESELLSWASSRIARFFEAEAIDGQPKGNTVLPLMVSDLQSAEREELERMSVEAVLPLRVSAEEFRYLLLGRRSGGRRYLSEDLEALNRIQAELVEQLDRHRELEMRRLVAQAELRALQSQIHPHFLFNALNTLYGIIPRESQGARRTVLNLADIFRYFLQTDRSYIALEEELRIVRAYLEIEALRLGNKLRIKIDVPDEALKVPIPILTIEPLVENAVKHGVSKRAEGGEVRVTARMENGAVLISVSDSGAGFTADSEGGTRVGLDNVIKRLKLCYGPESGLDIHTSAQGTEVTFRAPLREAEVALR